ncbi:MAG TPA: hypothetical protein VFZ11_10235 [Gemmatimonadaceae bacterium]
MPLLESLLPVLQAFRGAGEPAVTEMLPRAMLPAGMAIGIVVAMLWLARTARKGLGSAPAQSGGEATSAALLLVLAQRERELAAGGGATRFGTQRHVATPTTTDAVEPTDAAARYGGPVHCPACGAQLGVAGPALRYVTRCPACARWIASRVEGERVIVEARKG